MPPTAGQTPARADVLRGERLSSLRESDRSICSRVSVVAEVRLEAMGRILRILTDCPSATFGHAVEIDGPSPPPEQWDGRITGVPCPEGTGYAIQHIGTAK